MPRISGLVTAYFGDGPFSREEALKSTGFKLGDIEGFDEDVWGILEVPVSYYGVDLFDHGGSLDVEFSLKRGSALDNGVRVPAVMTDSADRGYILSWLARIYVRHLERGKE